jgi:hypothetical protein
MADNVGYTPGAGATVAADEIGGVLHQRIKLGIGDDGTAVDVSETNPMPVELVGVDATNPMPVRDDVTEHLLSILLGLLDSPRGYDKAQARQRGTVVLESGTLTALTTLSTLSNIAAIGGYSAQMQIMDTNRTGWAQCVRARIT